MAKLNREKQKAVLLQTQESRKKQSQQKVLEAVQKLQVEGKTITFPDVAKVAGVSVSYLYKWDNIKDYIQSLRDESKQQLHDLPSKDEAEVSRPCGHKTLHEVARKRIQALEAQIEELKQQNERYRGHVAKIYELREENERLRTQLRELTSPQPTGNVVPLMPVPKTLPVPSGDISTEITQMIQAMGMKLGVRLRKEIEQHTPEKVKLSIKAFQQYRSNVVVENPGACLLTMIREEAELNIPHEPTTSSEDEFDCWYTEAIRRGFCLDVPKNHLSIISGELQVKVKDATASGRYVNMDWRKAQEMIKNSQ